MDPLARRIAARFTQAGYSGWDQPDGSEPPDPEPTWDQWVEMFPRGLQRLLARPKRNETNRRNEQAVSLTGEVDLSAESGFSLMVEVTQGDDADEDGKYGYSNEKTEYSFYQGNQHWDGKDDRRFKQDLREFMSQLENHDPEGYAKAGL
jgi:hypothetical protein